MQHQPNHSDEDILHLLAQNSEQAIDLLFRQYYTTLCQHIYRIIPDGSKVEDLVQDVFYELWRKRDQLTIKTSIAAYLRRAARNKALNHIRDQRMQFEDEEHHPHLESKFTSSIQQIEVQELQNLIHTAIEALPERCRMVFSLSRFEEMSYQEIADALNISIKTVENQISKALKLLRSAVEHYQKGTD